MDDLVLDRVSAYLSYRHSLFHADLIERAMTDKHLSEGNFIRGVRAIIENEELGEDEFVPEEWENV